MTYSHWTDEDLAILQEGAGLYSWGELAQILGRNVPGVKSKAQKLGIAGKPSKGDFWTEGEVQILFNNAGIKSWYEISDLLGKSYQATATKAHLLGLKGRPRNADGQGFKKGELNPFYRDGTSSKSSYGKKWDNEIRPAVLLRDSYMCQYPSCDVYSPSGAHLHVHHIIPRPLSKDDSQSNLVTLCQLHHSAQVAHRWKDVTQELLDSLPEYQKRIREFQSRQICA